MKALPPQEEGMKHSCGVSPYASHRRRQDEGDIVSALEILIGQMFYYRLVELPTIVLCADNY